MAIKRGLKLSRIDTRALRDFGQRVRSIREKNGHSVYDVTGEDMPIKSRQHWQRIENGQKNINLTTVFRIARTLEIAAKNLFENPE